MPTSALSPYLPTGGSFDDVQFRQRHRMIWFVLAAHVPAVLAVGLLTHTPLLHAVAETAPLALLAWIVSQPLTRAALANVTSFALLLASGIMIHLTHGLPEMHMHLLVMLVLVALYEDVRAYLVAVGFVLVHHIGMSLAAPDSVFAKSLGRTSPILWSLSHAGLVVLETGIIMLFWKTGHDAQSRLELALEAQREEIDGRQAAEQAAEAQSAQLETRLTAEVEQKRRLDERTGELARQAGTVTEEMHDIGNAVTRLAGTAEGIGRAVAEATAVAAEATEQARATADVIADLGESRGKIEEILQVIHSIAGKTNLLALNATIEAARAGAVGKGFAVVAGEVKDLAGQTSAAVADIAETLQAIGTSTEAAVGAIDRIGAVVDHIAALQQSISGAVDEQRLSSEEISRTVADASEEVAKVLGGVRELAAV